MADISLFQPLGGLNGPVAAPLPSFGGRPHAGSGASVALQTGSGVSKTGFRQPLSAPGWLRLVREGFDRLPDPIAPRGLGLTDGRRSALARFRLPSPSRLSFEPNARDTDPIRSPLSNGSGGIRAPSESARRERLDPGDPRSVRRAFQPVFAALQRGQGWGGLHLAGRPAAVGGRDGMVLIEAGAG